MRLTPVVGKGPCSLNRVECDVQGLVAVAVDRHRPSVGFDVGNHRLQLRGVEIGAPLLGIVQIGNGLCGAFCLVGSIADNLHGVDRHHGIRDLCRRGAKAVFFVGLRILHGFVHQADAGAAGRLRGNALVIFQEIAKHQNTPLVHRSVAERSIDLEPINDRLAGELRRDLGMATANFFSADSS
jgi:hypothetical protein